MLNKEDLEKLEVNDIIHCYKTCLYPYYAYTLQIVKKKLSRNGYKYQTKLLTDSNSEPKNPILNFTINGSFRKDGTHNVKGRALRQYKLYTIVAVTVQSKDFLTRRKLYDWKNESTLNIQKKENIFYVETSAKNSNETNYDVLLDLENFKINLNNIEIVVDHEFKNR